MNVRERVANETPASLNESLGAIRTGCPTGVCKACLTELPHAYLDWEGLVRRGARRLECCDRSACLARQKRRSVRWRT